ncbi:MAG: SDR family oxidoreductase [Oligoflexia bacterium]|nr:SDR family oxidoreductase [Oligoflexia bacterium]
MNRTAIVTGASRGIGKAIALRLAKDGFQVAINYMSSKEEAISVTGEIEKAGGRAIAIKADVAKADEVEKLFAETERQLGKIDVLVNNAGLLKYIKLAEVTDEIFQRMVDTNLKGVFNTLRLAATRVNEGGRIINLSTSVLALGLPTYGVYVATKAAVESMSYVFARELRGRKITVNCVAPGPTATDLFLDGKTKEQIDHFAKMPPLERLGTPEDIAAVVSFLAGPDGAWVNGQVLRANGGLV